VKIDCNDDRDNCMRRASDRCSNAMFSDCFFFTGFVNVTVKKDENVCAIRGVLVVRFIVPSQAMA